MGKCWGGTRKQGRGRWLGSQALRKEVTVLDDEDADADVVNGDEVGKGVARVIGRGRRREGSAASVVVSGGRAEASSTSEQVINRVRYSHLF